MKTSVLVLCALLATASAAEWNQAACKNDIEVISSSFTTVVVDWNSNVYFRECLQEMSYMLNNISFMLVNCNLHSLVPELSQLLELAAFKIANLQIGETIEFFQFQEEILPEMSPVECMESLENLETLLGEILDASDEEILFMLYDLLKAVGEVLSKCAFQRQVIQMADKKIQRLRNEISKHQKALVDLVSQVSSFSQEFLTIKTSVFQEISSHVYQIQSKDRMIARLQRISAVCVNSDHLKNLKQELEEMKKIVKQHQIRLLRDMKRVSNVVKQYKENCQINFKNFLVWCDTELRKSLKPLVPKEVISQQIKFSALSPKDIISIKEPLSNSPVQQTGDPQLDKVNRHVKLLISTLECVAKNLIQMTKKTDKEYYKITDPLKLYSELPSPLAAPLPDYFKYQQNSSDRFQYLPNPVKFDTQTKKRLLQKLNESKSQLSPQKAGQLKKKIQAFQELKESDMLKIFKQEGYGISERQQIVFNLIHSQRQIQQEHVSLKDLLASRRTTFNFSQFTNRSKFQVSKNNYSKLLKKAIPEQIISDRFSDSDEIRSLNSSIDERVQASEQASISLKKKSPDKKLPNIRHQSSQKRFGQIQTRYRSPVTGKHPKRTRKTKTPATRGKSNYQYRKIVIQEQQGDILSQQQVLEGLIIKGGMKSIEYKIVNSQPQSLPGCQVESLLQIDQSRVWQVNSEAASLSIYFDQTEIQEIQISLFGDMQITIQAQKDQEIVSIIQNFEIGRKIVKYSKENYRNLLGTKFSKLNFHFKTQDQINVKIGHILLKQRRLQQVTPQRQTSNMKFLNQNFYGNSKDKTSKINQRRDSGLKQQTLNSKIIRDPLVSIEHPTSNNSYIRAIGYSPFQERNYPSVSNKQKRPVQSYSKVLTGKLIGCCLQDQEFKEYVRKMIDVMGGVYLEQIDLGVDYLVTVEQQRVDGVIQVNPEWIQACVRSRKIVRSEEFSPINHSAWNFQQVRV